MDAGIARTKIFVVSLRGQPERRKSFVMANRGTTTPWTFFDAYETLHPDLEYEEDAAVIAKGRPLTRGEIGCYSSHYALWKQLMEDDADQYVILEDDVIVDWQYLQILIAADHKQAGHDYLRLYYKKPVQPVLLQKNFLTRATSLVEIPGYCFGTQGYLITKNGAQRFVQQMRKIVRPVDDEMDRSWAHGVPNRAIFPFPVIEQSIASNIGAARFEPFAIPPRLKVQRFMARNLERARLHLSKFRTRRLPPK
jgi:glycosyl transferase, family 25